MNNLFMKQSFIGYIIKIAGVVVMGWGLIQGIISLFMMVQVGGHFMNEWGEMQHAGGLTGTALFAFLGIVATHFLCGLLIIGFGEVIDTLQKIYFHMDPEAKRQWEEEQKEKEEAVDPIGDVPFWVEQEVKGYYVKMQSNVQSIEKTSDPYVFKVSVDGRVDYMEVGNFEPRILSDEETAKFS
ncbi:hypothetical protein M3193_11205 [Sporosarcina luteola]|uniref:hypothetical protein n=1 Tax=Sporosarcina luteola TaxID=582850 RepID=UPI00203E24F2|nr:hypothetical protein [Sporosarcina luteola]MCM3744714.1 hypothetical protein [Sporosarcina luteola]